MNQNGSKRIEARNGLRWNLQKYKFFEKKKNRFNQVWLSRQDQFRFGIIVSVVSIKYNNAISR